LVYPAAFMARHKTRLEDGTLREDRRILAGESWERGKVILSWADIQRGIADFTDGQNVVLHEFAHQLDGLSGEVNGIPPLRGVQRQRWQEIFQATFRQFKTDTDSGRRCMLDPYGANDPAEFFAVVTEAFFEQSHALAQTYPALFQALLDFYRLDPRLWHQRMADLT
jgi:MtfA peptidase